MLVLFVGGAYFRSALDEIYPKLPLQFRDELSSRQVIDTFIWDRSMPANARRKYMIFLACGSVAFGLLSIFMFIYGPLLGALLFGAMFMLTAISTLSRWFRIRKQS